jgi:hypothetical protein
VTGETGIPVNDWVSFPKTSSELYSHSCSHVLAKVSSSKSASWRQELFGTIVQRLNLKHELPHTVPKLCILGFESFK